MINVPHNLGHLNASSPVGDAVWIGLGSRPADLLSQMVIDPLSKEARERHADSTSSSLPLEA